MKGCGESLCTIKECMYCVCGGTDSKGKLMLCNYCKQFASNSLGERQ